MHMFELIVTVVVTVIASSGFWTYLQSRSSKRDGRAKLLLGLAHSQIITVGSAYIARGWITLDEYDDFMNYLVDPYFSFGGNGMAKRITEEVKNLPIIVEFKKGIDK